VEGVDDEDAGGDNSSGADYPRQSVGEENFTEIVPRRD
jgi:hypothetical protein